MAFKMKGSAFKLNEVATKSVLKQKSPMKDSGKVHFAGESEKTQRGHDKAYGKGHPDSYHEMGQNPTPEEKKAFLEKQKSPNEMKSPMKDKKGERHPHVDSDKKYHTQEEFEAKSERYFEPEVVAGAKEARKNK